MSFFAEYDVDLNDFETSTGFDVPDGNYDFEITSAETRQGTSNDPNAVHIVVQYRLENASGEVYTASSWYKVPDDPNHPTQREQISMGDLKKLLLSAGIAEDSLNEAGPDDIIGMTGTLRMVTKANKKSGKSFQNATNHKFDEAETTSSKQEDEKPAKKTVQKTQGSESAKNNPFAR